jgi:hypothetical protein
VVNAELEPPLTRPAYRTRVSRREPRAVEEKLLWNKSRVYILVASKHIYY